jgi:hypothetical protein
MKSTYTHTVTYKPLSTYPNPHRSKANPHTPIVIDAFNAPQTIGIDYIENYNEVLEKANEQVSEAVYELILNV